MADDRFSQMLDALDGEGPSADAKQVEQAIRWRLVLGQFADEHLGFHRFTPGGGDGDEGESGGTDLADALHEAQQLDQPLNYIYDREHAQRLQRQAGGHGGDGLSVPAWLSRVRTLFPGEAVQVMEKDALHRYGLDELVTDAEVLRKQTPSQDLLKTILQFKHMMTGEVLVAARQIVKSVVDALRVTLENDCKPALHGAVDPLSPPLRTFKNTDWRRTIRANLKHYDVDAERLVVDRIYYRNRQRRRSDWRIIIAVDQSGSMVDSLIHAAVMSAIFCGLPSVDVRLILWDHRIVDLSDSAHDPLEVLMATQLGGGTNLLPAMEYCADLITDPHRTLMVVISDWYLFGESKQVLAYAKKLAEAGVHGIGLNALDAECRPIFDEGFARRLAGCGWFVASLTPKRLAEHIGRLIA